MCRFLNLSNLKFLHMSGPLHRVNLHVDHTLHIANGFRLVFLAELYSAYVLMKAGSQTSGHVFPMLVWALANSSFD